MDKSLPQEDIPRHILEDLALIGDVPHRWLAALLREKGKHLYQEGIIGRLYCLSTCANAASAWGSQKVISMAQ